MRILYVNQTGAVSGAERSLLDLLGALPASIDPLVACPPGPLTEMIAARGADLLPLPETEISFRLHPVHTARGLAALAGGARRIRRLVRELAPDLVHANTTRAGLAALPAGALGGPPVIVHQRDWVPEGMVAAGVLRVITAGASAVIANSGHIARQLPRGRGTPPIHVIHDAVDTTGIDGAPARARAREALDLTEGEVALAVVAQLTPWKGQDDAIRALAQLKPKHPQLRLMLAGSAKFTAPGARFDNAGFERRLRSLAIELEVEREVAFLGEREDVPAVLAAADVLLVPSWQEAFGRIVVEGMAAGLPVVATSEGGPAELVRDGVDGLLLAPQRPQLWAEAVGGLLSAPRRLAEMGDSGRERAHSELAAGRLVAEVVSVYDDVFQASRP